MATSSTTDGNVTRYRNIVYPILANRFADERLVERFLPASSPAVITAT
jgi:hypothetical protein